MEILLSGSDTDGRQFSERTKTLVLSRHGASVLSRYKMVPEQELFLRSTANNREIEVRVCGEIGERQDGHIYGVAFLDQAADFWGIEFPPSQSLPISLREVTLECTGCRERATANFDATEMDVYTVNDGLLRYCKRCLGSTVWKRATGEAVPARAAGDVREEKAVPAEPSIVSETGVSATTATTASTAQAPAAPAAVPNRRRERRTKVKCNACVRSPGGSEEVVACEDLSRGGFSFRSTRQYSEEAMIEVAVPYTPGNSIFVPAQIANVRKLQEGKLFRYGASYIQTSGRG
jgi:PilZ domain